MNLPIPLPFLWFVPIALLTGSALWRRFQKHALLVAQGRDSSLTRLEGWRHSRVLPAAACVLGLLCAYTLWRFSAPTISGVVVDAATGQPIANALVARKVFRSAQTSITEGPMEFTEPWSRVETRTDSRGRFRLPAYVSPFPIGIRGECGMSWVVFATGFMIAGECERAGFPVAGGCGPEGGFVYPDPWVRKTTRRGLGGFRMEVRPRHIPPESGGLWEEYFRRLNLLTQDRYVAVSSFAAEALKYLEHQRPSEGMVDDLAELADRLPLGSNRDTVARAVVTYCHTNPTSFSCKHAGPSALAAEYSRGASQR